MYSKEDVNVCRSCSLVTVTPDQASSGPVEYAMKWALNLKQIFCQYICSVTSNCDVQVPQTESEENNTRRYISMNYLRLVLDLQIYKRNTSRGIINLFYVIAQRHFVHDWRSPTLSSTLNGKQ